MAVLKCSLVIRGKETPTSIRSTHGNSVQCFPPHMLNKPFKAHRNTTSYQRIPIMDFQKADFGYVSDVLHVASHLTVKRELTSNHICYM